MDTADPTSNSPATAPRAVGQRRLGIGGLRSLVARWMGCRTEQPEAPADATRIAEIARRMPLAVITTDTEARITWANPAFLRLTEYAIDQVLGRRPADILQGPLTDRNESRRIGEAIRARKPVTTELINYTASGRPYFVRIDIEPLLDEAGNHIGFMGIETDISAQRTLERQLRQEHALVAAVLSHIPYAVFWKDTSSRFIGCNQAFAQFVGQQSPEQIVGRTDLDLCVTPAQANLYRQDDLAVITSGRAKLHIEETINDTAGRTRSIRTSKVPLRDNTGAVVGVLGIYEDVTEQKQIEHQVAESQRLESIGQLAAGIAHEINTPTQYVSDNLRFLAGQFEGLIQLIEKLLSSVDSSEMPTPWKERIDAARQATTEVDYDFLRREVPLALTQSLEGLDRVAAIVRAVRDFSHPGSDAHEPADINRGIRSTIEVCRNRWKTAAHIETSLAENLPQVHCRIDEINQVILNLIINATDAIIARHGEDNTKGCICISSQCLQNGLVEIRVSDNGTGVPESVKNRIFDPFFTTKQVGKGTGQGLALSRNVVVKNHGGDLAFETRPGNGTTFIVRLPVQPAARQNSGTSAKEAA